MAEDELRSLVKTVKNVQKELGGLSHTVAYALEDNQMIDNAAVERSPEWGIRLELLVLPAAEGAMELCGGVMPSARVIC